MSYLILRPECGSASAPVPVEGKDGILGMATWNSEWHCHALEVSDEVYRKNLFAFADFLPKYDKLAVIYVGQSQKQSELSGFLDEYRQEGETDAKVLLRILSDAAKLHKYRPFHGKRPETFLDAVAV